MEKNIEENITFKSISSTIKESNLKLAERCYNHLLEIKEIDFSNHSQINFFLNNDQLQRFKNARDDNEDKAYDMFIKWVKWRLEKKPENIKPIDIQKDLNIGKFYHHGFDKQGRPIMIVKTGKHIPSETTFEDSLKLGLYWVERITKIADQTKEKNIIVIVDRKDVSWSNIDYGALKNGSMISTLQDFYADRVYKILIIQVDFIFNIVMKLGRAFMASKTKEKMHICNDISELKKYVDEDQLLIEHGGTSDYVYSPPEN